MNVPVRTEAVTKAYSYVRFSTPSQAAGASLQRQTEKAAKYALEHGLTLDTELKMTDLGVSAYRGKNAHQGALGGFLRAVDAGYVERGSYLLIENMDRLSRADIVTAQGLFLQLVGSGINLVTLTNGEAYSAERFQREPEAIFLVVLELIRANKESVRKGQLVGDAKARKKQRLAENGLDGKPYTRQTPAWITWSDKEGRYELIKERADVVREMFERMDKGDGLTRIARDLNQRGLPTWPRSGDQRTADHWRTSYIRKVLASSAPIGTFTPHTTTHDETTRSRRDEPMAPVENLFPAAVDADVYWRVNRKLSTKAARGRNARQPTKSIVSGIIFCATCGHAVTRVAKGDYVYLVCSRANMRAEGCDYKAVRYDTVDKALRENVRGLIKEAPRGKSTAALEKQIEELQANADRVEQWVFDLADLAARNRTPVADRRLGKAERELKAIQKQLRDLRTQRDTMTTASVKDRLKAVEHVLTKSDDVAETNAALRDAIRRIVLDPVQGHLWIRWHHSEEIQDVPCGTRHMDWTEMRETTPPMHALFPEKAAADTNGQLKD
ncbi:recombinase family protein [Bradyrhizobium sp. 35]|uniref:recombinase family protein n=1 Tax=Bradyrhizobium sp. 35 TaxID=2782670 RepID=UPI001FFA7A4F|nr:recombinase family protein [Bradyrhizobium sp. 35]MCK1454354.1 recombinase family protein [Bradyrhizobium sp. 35]